MTIIGGIDMGNLTDYLFFFADGRDDANWQGATKGFVGDVAVDGIQADERTSGSVPYAGTIYTNDNTLGAWQDIIDQNPLQASGVTNQVVRIDDLEADLVSAFNQINALAPTPGYESVSSTSLNGLNTQNSIDEVFVINITSGLNFSDKIYITGDPGDVFILRWDEDPLTPGYQGQVKPQSGGAIVPQGGLEPGNFINVAGDINSSGGGTTPAPPYPQGPRFNDGQGALINGGSDFSGGGFFTGYWLTTGQPTALDPEYGLLIGDTQSLSNGIFVGGWYTLTTQFSMTSGTSGVYVSPNPATTEAPDIDVEKLVSPDNGTTFFDADTPTGPNVIIGTNPRFKFVVTNTGNETLNNITLVDDVYGPITIPTTTLDPGESFEVTIVAGWAAGQQMNTATVEGTGTTAVVTDSDPAYWFGTTASIDVEKLVSPDGGLTYFDADTPTGPNVIVGTDPQFKFVVTNNGNETLTNITLVDDVFGSITIPTTTLAPGESFEVNVVGTWAPGQQVNTATVEGDFDGQTYTDTDPAYWYGTSVASIDIEKLVSVDGGVTFVDSDTPPGPYLNPNIAPQFKFVVTNNGNAPLTDVTVTDTDLGFIGAIPLLNPGDSQEFTETGVGEFGQHTNTATAEGTFNNTTVTDSDPAHYFGIPECFRQVLVNGNLTIPPQKPDVEQVVDLDVTTDVYDIDLFPTIDGTKVVVSGFAEIGITYVADNPEQTEHYAHFKVPFTATFVCPQISCRAKVEPVIIIEHVQWHKVNSRTIKKFIVMLVGISLK